MLRGARLAGLTLLLIAPTAMGISPPPSEPYQATLTVAAANSLKDALRAILPVFEREQGSVEVRIVWGPSQTLREQIEQGAPVDVFLPSSLEEIDHLEKKGLILAGTKQIYAETGLVLITQAAFTLPVSSFLELPASDIRRVAIGDPKTSSVGKFAVQALRRTHLDHALKSRYVYGEHSSAVLHLVATGEADVGIVYRTDAIRNDKVRILAEAPPDTHAPIVYGMATVWTSKNSALAKKLADFMQSPPVQHRLRTYGFERVSSDLSPVHR